MKKILFVGFFGLISVLNSKVNAQAVEQGNIIIDPYYGGPNFGKSFSSGLDGADFKVKGVGPMGLRAEYMVADKFGIGVDFIYNTLSATGNADSLNLDGSLYKTYEVKAKMSRIRIQARFNYHFVENDKVDAYFGVGAGSNLRNYSVKTDYPNYDDESANATLLPVSLRLAVGTRYYFTENIGINAEIGLGGPVVSAGISLKF